MKKFMRVFLLVLVALIIIWTFWFLYSKSQPKVTMYNVVKPERMELTKTSVATGKVEPRNEILIKPQVSGIIDKLFFEAGQMIKKDDIIARVKVIPDMGQLNSAENRLKLASLNQAQSEREWARNEQLYADKLISREEYEQAKVKVEQAREETFTAQNALDIVRKGVSKRTASISNTNIRSTIEGLILDVPVKEGNSVIMSNTFNDGTTIASVANMSDLIFRGNVDETEVGQLYEGMPVKLKIGALQNMDFEAKLEYVSPKGVETNGTMQFEVKAAVSVPDSITIRSGYSANAEFVLKDMKDALAIPEGLIEFRGDSTFVYKLEGEDPQTFKRVAVKTGMSNGVYMQIISGIDDADQLRGTVVSDEVK